MGEFDYTSSEEEVIIYSLKRKISESFQMKSGDYNYPSSSGEESEEEVTVSRIKGNSSSSSIEKRDESLFSSSPHEEEPHSGNEGDDDDQPLYDLLVRPLSDEDRARAIAAWDCDEDSDRVVGTINAGAGGSTVDILEKHLFRMHPERWLWDATIDGYIFLLEERDKRLCDADTSRLPNYFFSSYFFNKMFEHADAYSYQSVRRWANKVTSTGGNIFKLNRLIIPVNESRTHWCLCVAYIQEKRIQYYDSMGGSGLFYMNGLKMFLKDEAKKFKGDDSLAHLLNIDSWELVRTNTAVTPKQTNGYDCGVFTSMFANYLSLGLELRFSERDMTYFRERMTVNILDGFVE